MENRQHQSTVIDTFRITITLVIFIAGFGQTNAEESLAKAVFAGGCFWCMEPPYDEIEGVLKTTSGYTGGELPNPSYDLVASGRTAHIESVQIEYDPERISYKQLLEVFWKNIDPLDAGGQFCDRGNQYTSAIFFSNADQQDHALKSKQTYIKRFDEPIATKVEPLTIFYPAEEYHQNYYKKNPIRYKFYRLNCGRDSRLEELWEP